MRIWEIFDNNAVAADLVREQDFIMRVRRLNRLGTPHLIINLVLSGMAHLQNRAALEAAQKQLEEFARITSGSFAEMSNGDVFLVWEERADTHALPARLIAALIPEDDPNADTSKFMLLFTLPDGYTPLRERLNQYVESAQAAAIATPSDAGNALQSDEARGPLTAWSVDQIETLLGEIDLHPYLRTQAIYDYGADGRWHPYCEEYFVSFEELRRERFPKLTLSAPEHLFMELCQVLDQRLLAELTAHFDRIAGKRAFFNLSIASVLKPAFVPFCRTVPRDQRALIGFELHRGDLLQDFALTLDAIKTIRREGFQVAIDGITPDMIRYLNLAAFEADFFKINVAKDYAAQLADPAIRHALMQLPRDKLIFFRCDNEAARALGLEIGVSKFQGWLIDDAVEPPRGG